MINIAELLKDCPKGMELYSPLCGKCVFDRLNMGTTIVCKKQNTQEITFTREGYYMLPVFDDCECMIFPSKDQRDWSKFQRPFKDGDIVFYNDTIAIFKEWGDETLFRTHVTKYLCCDSLIDVNVPLFGKSARREIRFATEEEKQKLFHAIKDNGYKWNAETKTLEKLINKNKFVVGATITNGKIISKIVSRDIDSYQLEDGDYVFFNEVHNWKLASGKFDLNTLKPFDKVLVRGGVEQRWIIDFFGFMDNKKGHPFVCVGHYVSQCIPYEGNEHLLDKTDDCEEFYKTW